MEKVNPFRGTIKKCCVLLLFSFVLTITGKSQNIFLSDSPGVFTFGQFSQVQNFDGPAIGLNYSINGKSALGVSYGASSINGRNYQSLSILANLLIKKQADGDLFNVDVIPAYERKYHEISHQNLSLFSLTTGISRDFSQNSDFNFIPRASFSYLVSPSVGVTNYLSAGMDMNMGFELNKNVKFIVNPGITFRLDNGRYNGIFTSGLLIH